MFGFRSMKEIKKKLKRKRRHVWSLGMLAAVFLAAAAAGTGGAVLVQRAVFTVPVTEPASASEPSEDSSDRAAAAAAPRTSREAALRALALWKGEVEMVLHRNYWCGQETRMLGRRPAGEAAELLKSRRDWEAFLDPAGRLYLEEPAEDVSPACRLTAYIGLDGSGNLSLFDGPPRKDNVVRTFFQLDIRSLESSLSKERLRELATGIRVTDREQCDSVLAGFSDYAFRKSEGVMKRER